MSFDRYLQQGAEWVAGQGPRADLVVSTRIRLARNVTGIHFGGRATPAMKERILAFGEQILARAAGFRGGEFYRLAALPQVQREFFVERHIVSPPFANEPDQVGLVVDPAEVASAVLNEEDHLRLQLIRGGLAAQEVWAQINELDNQLQELMPYSHSAEWGYLTACPTNTGTGMRVSVLIHLPALVLTREIGKVLRGIGQLEMVVRGFHGEGSEVVGHLFQISNQRTLGVDEDTLVERIETSAQHVIEYEQRARAELMTGKKRTALEDRVWRAIGELKSARLLTSKEVINLVSIVRLGVSLGLIANLSLRTLNELFLLAQPAHLQLVAGRELGPEERDERRSHSVREKLADFQL